MGWLRELLRSAEPPIDGYGELARRTLEHPEWPPDCRPQARSLAALYSKLDRNLELEWLAEREAVQRTLALTLACPLETVRRPLEALRDSRDTRRVRFEDLPFAKPLDLDEEDLPPGIPAAVLEPRTWAHLWWQAPAGSGRSLVGRWLSARELAAYVSGREWSDVRHRLPPSGPVFVELERAVLGESIVPDRAELCVAAPSLPPRQPDPAASSCWRVIASPVPAEFVAPLLAWIEARLPEDGAFDRVAAAHWLAAPIAEGTLPTLGALLGVAGALDAEGARHSRSENLHELAARFVNERLARASGKGSAEAQWLQRYGFEVLVKLAQEVLVADDQPWDVARSQDEWIARIPAEYQQSIDGAWIQWSLARAGERATARELERSLRELPPGAYRLVRALADARLLRPRGASGSLAIAPEFLKHAAVQRARYSLVYESSPFAWGEALLRPHAAPAVLETVYARSSSDDFAWVDALLELNLSSQPALVAAAEAAFVCLGLRVLCGAEPPSECVLGLWNEQLAWLAPGEELPTPRLLHYEGATEHSALSDPAVFGLAALALSELLGPGQGSPHALLRPAYAAQPSPDLPRLFDAIYDVVRSPRLAEIDWAAAAFALADRLAQASPTLTALVGGHPLARPAQIVRAFQREQEHPIAIEDVGSTPIEVRALKLAGEHAGLAWETLAQALWRAWQARPQSGAGDALLGPDSACHALFWPHLPADVIDSACARWAARDCPLGCWGPSQWSSFVSRFGRHFARQPHATLWVQAFEQMDRATLERAISDSALWNASESDVRPLFAIAWRRAPEHLLALLVEHVGSGATQAVLRLLQSAPSSADEALFTVLGPALAPRTVQRPVLEATRTWLAARVRARRAHWRQAYTLCAELEERIRRAMRARGV